MFGVAVELGDFVQMSVGVGVGELEIEIRAVGGLKIENCKRMRIENIQKVGGGGRKKLKLILKLTSTPSLSKKLLIESPSIIWTDFKCC